MSTLLTPFLPVKDTTTAIGNKARQSGQLLFETDEKHRLFLDYSNSEYGYNLDRHTLIDCNETLEDFDISYTNGDASGYNNLIIRDGASQTRNIEIPHSRFSRGSSSNYVTISSEGTIPVFTFNCRTDVDEDYGLFLKPILTVIGATVMNPSTFEDEDGMCCTIQPTRMSMTVGTDYNTLSITYPPFFKEIYGVEIPSGESITLWCYLYDCSNNGGCNFWIGS